MVLNKMIVVADIFAIMQKKSRHSYSLSGKNQAFIILEISGFLVSKITGTNIVECSFIPSNNIVQVNGRMHSMTI